MPRVVRSGTRTLVGCNLAPLLFSLFAVAILMVDFDDFSQHEVVADTVKVEESDGREGGGEER